LLAKAMSLNTSPKIALIRQKLRVLRRSVNLILGLAARSVIELIHLARELTDFYDSVYPLTVVVR